ncbi:unnamed protein product, partial [Polarella glacialis]
MLVVAVKCITKGCYWSVPPVQKDIYRPSRSHKILPMRAEAVGEVGGSVAWSFLGNCMQASCETIGMQDVVGINADHPDPDDEELVAMIFEWEPEDHKVVLGAQRRLQRRRGLVSSLSG